MDFYCHRYYEKVFEEPPIIIIPLIYKWRHLMFTVSCLLQTIILYQFHLSKTWKWIIYLRVSTETSFRKHLEVTFPQHRNQAVMHSLEIVGYQCGRDIFMRFKACRWSRALQWRAVITLSTPACNETKALSSSVSPVHPVCAGCVIVAL